MPAITAMLWFIDGSIVCVSQSPITEAGKVQAVIRMTSLAAGSGWPLRKSVLHSGLTHDIHHSGAVDVALGAADIVLTKPGLFTIVSAVIGARKISQRMTTYAK